MKITRKSMKWKVLWFVTNWMTIWYSSICRVQTSNGIAAQEQGKLKQVAGAETPSIAVRGSYRYIAADGLTYEVNYVADENGFQPQVSVLLFCFYFFHETIFDCSLFLVSLIIAGCSFTSCSSCLIFQKQMKTP